MKINVYFSKKGRYLGASSGNLVIQHSADRKPEVVEVDVSDKEAKELFTNPKKFKISKKGKKIAIKKVK